MTTTRKTLSELARHVGGKVVGDDQVEIRKVAGIEEAGPGEITFLAHPRYQAHLARCRASAVIVSSGVAGKFPSGSIKGFLEASNPYIAFAKILQLFAPSDSHSGEISALSAIDPSATVGPNVTVYPHVFIGKGVVVGSGSVLYPGVFLDEGSIIGRDCVLHANVTVREKCRLGDRVILHPGAVIGSDGFGYAGEGSQRVKIPQVGMVEIEDDVEIGANTTVDRATLGRTIIRRGTKIDNLVQIAHNVVVGEHSIIAAQVGIAGSTHVGNNVILAGQVGVINHLEIGDGAKIGPQSGIARSVPPGVVLSGGIEAAPHREWLKVMTLLPQLPKLWGAVRTLDKKVSQLLGASGKEAKGHDRR